MLRGMILLVVVALLVSAVQAIPSAPIRITTRYAMVTSDPGPNAVALVQQVAALIDNAVPKAAEITGTTDLSPVPAVVYHNREQFSQATGVPRDNPIVGLAVYPENVIYLDGSGVFSAIGPVVIHEVGHVMVYRRLGSRVIQLPRWFNEGVAEYIANPQPAYFDPTLLLRLRQGGTITVSKLDAAFQDQKLTGSAYAESASLMEFLVDRYGNDIIARILTGLNETPDFARVLKNTTNLTLPTLDTQWRAWLRPKWWWMPDLNLLLWFIMVVLLMMAFIRMLRRRKRRELAEEEIDT